MGPGGGEAVWWGEHTQGGGNTADVLCFFCPTSLTCCLVPVTLEELSGILLSILTPSTPLPPSLATTGPCVQVRGGVPSSMLSELGPDDSV